MSQAADIAPYRVRSGIRDPHQWSRWLQGLFGARYDGLTHFAVVDPGMLMRCGQPRIRDLERIKAEHGLATVVVARGGTRHPLRGRWFRKQQRWCQANGVVLQHMPFSDAATPPADIFERFLAVFAIPQRRPVLVHCEQGFHRTGILCAAYRIRVDGWPLDRALEELRAAGFEWDRPKRGALVDALRAWAAEPATGN